MKKIKGAFDVEPHIVEKEFKTNLGSGNNIFVGSSTDMWGKWIPEEWIRRVLDYIKQFPENQYLLQTKNPLRFADFTACYSDNMILCTTAESSTVWDRLVILKTIKEQLKVKTAITIEPVMDFDFRLFLDLLIDCDPVWIAIGANTSNVKLKEPTPEKLDKLIHRLAYHGIKLHLKDNLKRIFESKGE